MKKSILLLGAFLATVAIAQAKEIIPVPVVVEEEPVEIVENDVILVQEQPEVFKPNGSLDLQYRYYGETEGKDRANTWNPNNDYSRTQIKGNINMTKNQSLEFRVRDYNSLNEHPMMAGSNNNGTESRFRYFYDHGKLGDSKVDLRSRVQYKNNTVDKKQNVEYQARFNFADYMFNNDFVKTDYFEIAPTYGYTWGSNNSSNYENKLGLNLYSYFTLPLNFSTEFNLYATEHFYGRDQLFNDGMNAKDKNLTLDMEFYIYNTTNLYKNGGFAVDLGFEGGYDPYTWSQEKQFGTPKNNTVLGTDKDKYSLYALPYVQANYAVTDNMSVYAAAGAEYRNWTIDSNKSASTWRWQPTVWAGFKTTF
ncbi:MULTISPECIES: hypothetical protein [unclassified Fusobacterium]|uniref:major outer membrane protein FomA n=1 Tax=unclassified Fusobacterium TaxID=2648384 RepID=UPI0025C522A9|nr:hypothetical protein [Fusobacterium sp.]